MRSNGHQQARCREGPLLQHLRRMPTAHFIPLWRGRGDVRRTLRAPGKCSREFTIGLVNNQGRGSSRSREAHSPASGFLR